ncbi:hypothetical protein CALCODRAFT_488228 [Calocera cornea HHB12733]|uniref:Uncharacterized protein n=1 Tax=Calocera cornea HHB12733 TaxID=1353952 RepID=A0A165CMM9_9BASI|nr:hypothetical protein CALCODRAFT_488228 [Calocera cornea HHB12733]
MATNQVQYNGGDGPLYDCADIILLADYTVPSSAICTNSTAATNTSSASSVTLSSHCGSNQWDQWHIWELGLQ